MDRVIIEALQIDTVIGAYAFEQHYPQRLYLDLELAWDHRRAAESDDLQYALDYAEVCRHLREYAANRQFQLLETLADRFAGILHETFKVNWLRLHIRKPSALAYTESVGISLERSFE